MYVDKKNKRIHYDQMIELMNDDSTDAVHG